MFTSKKSSCRHKKNECEKGKWHGIVCLANASSTTINVWKYSAWCILQMKAKRTTEESTYWIELSVNLWTTATECFPLTSSANDYVECNEGITLART